MNDLEKRVTDLENKVKILEETLETLKNMNLSEQMEGYIKKRSQALKMVNLLNAVSDQPAFDFSQEEAKVSAIQSQKAALDKQIAKALANESVFSDQYQDDPRYFDYEIENGMEKGTYWNEQKSIRNLKRYAGKGIRITGYNGFDTKRVVIPQKIDGLPVTSIGEKAFINATFSEIIIPKTLKAILTEAFKGCKNLQHISLPEGLLYLGDSCFNDCGIEDLKCPKSIKTIPSFCFSDCKLLHRFYDGRNIKTLECGAFKNCESLTHFQFSETLEEINNDCFTNTSIKLFIIPSSVKAIESETFNNHI